MPRRKGRVRILGSDLAFYFLVSCQSVSTIPAKQKKNWKIKQGEINLVLDLETNTVFSSTPTPGAGGKEHKQERYPYLAARAGARV